MNNPFTDLSFGTYDFRLKRENDKAWIFDELRKKWLVCSPEEWVRQNLIKFLINEHKFPSNLIALEKSLSLAGRDYRFDALVYDKDYLPLLIIECKAVGVKLEQTVFDQIWNYNYEINAPFFLITNGRGFVMGSCIKGKEISFFDSTLDFEDLLKLKINENK